MKNRYGVDTDYFYKWGDRVFRDLSNYKPDELARELARMAKVADSEVLKEPEFRGEEPSVDEMRKAGAL